MNKSKALPLIIIVGPTASGKTSLAIYLAEKFGGEIICADSRSIYKGADIGTAKATEQEQERVVHHGLDLVEPGDYFTVSDFKLYANKKIKEIRKRGHLPFLTGGTGLYIDAVMFDFEFANQVNFEKRQELEALSLEKLHEYCTKNNITLPENYKNRRYVIRAIESGGMKPKRSLTPINNCIVVGIATGRDELRNRIQKRSESFFDNGVIQEAKNLADKYGWNSEAMKSNAYKLIRKYLDSEISYLELKQKNITADWRLAKRQMTWLKRNSFIKWMPLDDAREYLCIQLAKYK